MAQQLDKSQQKAKAFYDSAVTHGISSDMNGKAFDNDIKQYLIDGMGYKQAIIRATQKYLNLATNRVAEQGGIVLSAQLDSQQYDAGLSYYISVDLVIICPKGVETIHPYVFLD